jgi:hypothetical protein
MKVKLKYGRSNERGLFLIEYSSINNTVHLLRVPKSGGGKDGNVVKAAFFTCFQIALNVHTLDANFVLFARIFFF